MCFIRDSQGQQLLLALCANKLEGSAESTAKQLAHRDMSSQLLQIGRTLFSPVLGAASWFNSTAQAHPFATGVIFTGLKTSAADIFAQKVIERRENMDWTRHAVFCTFGFAYLGGFQYYLYNIKFTQWCGPITKTFGHRATAPIKTAIDQFIHHPFLYFPTFFAMKAVVSGKPLSSAVEKYRTEIWDSVKALWAVWIPFQLINFAFVPRHFRVPYAAGVSFGWTIILSVMQGKFDAKINQAIPANPNGSSQAPAPAAPPMPQLPPSANPALTIAQPKQQQQLSTVAVAEAGVRTPPAAAPAPAAAAGSDAQGGAKQGAPLAATAVERGTHGAASAPATPSPAS